jgi:hypothetical protein
VAYRSSSARSAGEASPAQTAQRAPGRDRGDVPAAAGQPGERGGTGQRRAEEGLLGDPPHVRRAFHQRRPLPAGGGPQRRVESGGDVGRVSGDGQAGAVGEAVGDRRVEADQIVGVLEWSTGGGEQVPVDLREGDQARAGVERVAVAGVPAELAAHGGRLLEHRDVVPERRQPRRGRQTPQPGAHHRHPRHGATVGRGRGGGGGSPVG